jgi:hypothetical protein
MKGGFLMNRCALQNGPSVDERYRTLRFRVLTLLAAGLWAAFVPGVVAAGPAHDVTFGGPIESLPAGPALVGDWTVAGVVVHVSATAAIDQSKGAAAVGALVQVKGAPRTDRSIDATEIKVLRSSPPQPRPRPQAVEVAGLIVTLPAEPPFVGDWLVDETTVHVVAATRVDERHGAVAVGAFVLVRGTRLDDRSIKALSVEVKRPAQPRSECGFVILHLTATEAAPAGAEGVVLTRRVVLPNGSEREDLKVAVEHLLPESSYDVVVDGLNAGVIVTDAQSEGHLFLSTSDVPGAEPLPAELRPVADRVHAEVLAGNVAVLAGDFEDARRHGCGNIAPDYLAAALLLGEDGAPRGVAVASIKADLQILRIAAWSLAPGAVVTLLLDGEALGKLTTGADGTAHLVLSSSPGAGQLPLPAEAQPVSDLLHVELQAADGSLLAAGNLAPVPGP